MSPDVGWLVVDLPQKILKLGPLRFPAVNSFWENESFHNYADYAMGSEFQESLQKLRKAGHARRCAIMCAEAVWWRCHRRIIADYLIAAGEAVLHILGPGRMELARRTEAAMPGPSGVLIYPGNPHRQLGKVQLRIETIVADEQNQHDRGLSPG
jgi:hypothetical protein